MIGIAENLENTTDGGFVIGTYGGTIHKTDSNFNIGTTASITGDIIAPEFFSLLQNFPNPFNNNTVIDHILRCNHLCDTLFSVTYSL